MQGIPERDSHTWQAEGEEARDNGDKAMSRSPTPEEAAKDVSPTLSNE